MRGATERCRHGHDEKLASPGCPELAELYVSDRCALQCIHCFHADTVSRDPPLTAAEWVAAVDQLVERGCRRFHLSGREPFANLPVTLAVLAHLARLKSRYRLTVGAISDGLSWRTCLPKIDPAMLDYLEISVDGPPDIHDEIRGREVASLVGRSVELAGKLLPSLTLSTATTLFSRNSRSVPALLQWAWSLGIRRHFMQPMQAAGRAKVIREGCLSGTGYQRLIANVQQFLVGASTCCQVVFFIPYELRADVEHLKPCSDYENARRHMPVALQFEPRLRYSGSHVIVTHDGHVIPHFTLRSSGDYVKHSWGSLRSQQLDQILRRPDQCLVGRSGCSVVGRAEHARVSANRRVTK